MKISLDAFWLKVIALISMTIDHIGYFLFPDLIILRIIGRLAFVIFAYFCANAYIYTSNRLKYGLTLLVLGLIMDVIVYTSGFYVTSNIFITLGLGFFLIYGYDKNQYWLIALILILLAFIKVDYGYYGVLVIFASYIFFKRIDYLMFANIVLITIFFFLKQLSDLQYYSIFGIGLLFLYNYQRGYSIKYFFYLYYPLHILILQYLSTKI